MLIPFDVTHLEGFTPRKEESGMFKTFGDISERIETLAQSGEAFSFIKNNKLIAFGGVYEMWKGNAEVWMIPSPDFSKYQLEACKHLRGLFQKWYGQFRRVQTTSLHNNLHHRFMTFLGLEREGILRKFGPEGEDFALYSKVGS